MAEKLHGNLNMDSPQEEQIVALALAGDVAAFGDLYERYLDDIYHYIYYRVSSQQEAEDLSEAVFLSAWQALDDNPPREAPFLLWLYRIAHNTVVDHYRMRKEQVGLEAAAHIADPIEGPEEIVTNWEGIAELRQAMRQLNEDHQEVLICRFIVGLSHAETATVMNRSEQAVRALQYRAIVVLRNLLKHELLKNELLSKEPHKNGQPIDKVGSYVWQT
jgi:RNA polymerase sigma-70 factor (ECF subfamily)